jgi:hypothetical protein
MRFIFQEQPIDIDGNLNFVTGVKFDPCAAVAWLREKYLGGG